MNSMDQSWFMPSHSDKGMNRLPDLLVILLLSLQTVPAGAQIGSFHGADVSWLPQMEASGFVFRNRVGQSADCLVILKSLGFDTLRLRTFVNPSEDPRDGHCSAQEMTALAVRGRDLGFSIAVDFHYSDTWADPGHQSIPAAWAGLDLPGLEQAVGAYTFQVLAGLKKAGVIPVFVQVGNEINSGMLLPQGDVSAPDRLARLFNAGADAVRLSFPGVPVAVHLASGTDLPALLWFLERLTASGGRFDMIGVSYYPYWDKQPWGESIAKLGAALNALAQRYGKPVMVLETGGVETRPSDTRDQFRAVGETLSLVPGGLGRGFFLWEPEAASSWSGYALSSWGADGRPTIALDVFDPRELH